MKDPNVEELVDTFYEQVAALNVTWSKLSKEGVYISTKVENPYNMDEKVLMVDQIRQTVDYKRQPAPPKIVKTRKSNG